MRNFEGVTLYDWTIFFKSLAKAIDEIGKNDSTRNEELKNKAVRVFGLSHQISNSAIVDPLSFIYALAQRNTANQKQNVFTKTIEIFNLNVSLPTDWIFPTPSPNTPTLYYDGANKYITKAGEEVKSNLLWSFFSEAVNKNDFTPLLFSKVLSIKNVGVAKLTQTLFLIDPEKFIPVDANTTWIVDQATEERLDILGDGWLAYKKFLAERFALHSGCLGYEINLFYYLTAQSNSSLQVTANYFQISSSVEGSDGGDFFDDFIEANAVWVGGSGEDRRNGAYPLSNVNRGDIILIRRGVKNLGGIGVVIENQYQPNGFSSESVIRIIWINKKSIKLDYGLGDWSGFNGATEKTKLAFRDAYQDIFSLLETIQNEDHPMAEIPRPDFNCKSLNQILYGPPGTGKTYNSISEAVKIADAKDYDDDFDFKARFDELRKENRIEFVTFHQNYSYEDFMVGIRPATEESNLKFVKHKGIFYEFVQRARDNYMASLMHDGTLVGVTELINNLLERLRNDEKIQLKTSTGVDYSIEYLSEESIQLIYSNGSRNNTLSIDTLTDITDDKREYTSSLKTYYLPLKNYLLKDRIRPNTLKTELKNHVIIIDEINRANISRVFGELITLLEKDKRLGADHELRVTLPNGEKDFGIPPNLYIIGTMNTADKSIALVDIALRRRFEFKGYYPKKELLDELVKKELLATEASELLQHINNRIFEKKKSADFLIGHAYFINKKSGEISDVLQTNIIPLLMEYFSGKTEEVTEILKGSAYQRVYSKINFSWELINQ